jgi:hypothetical protein
MRFHARYIFCKWGRLTVKSIEKSDITAGLPVINVTMRLLVPLDHAPGFTDEI